MKGKVHPIQVRIRLSDIWSHRFGNLGKRIACKALNTLPVFRMRSKMEETPPPSLLLGGEIYIGKP